MRRRTYPGSSRALARASVIPGSSLTRSKAPGRLAPVGQGPHFVVGGRGAVVTDVDGYDYIDMVCALGAVSIGHGECLGSVYEALNVGGWLYSLPTPAEAAAAEAVLEVVAPWATRVRFVKTGSEATHAAMRIAKLLTGRPLVMAGDWSYHGWHEWACPGQDDRTLRYRHEQATGYEALDVAIERADKVRPALAEDVAAVFVEPHRWETMTTDWLGGVRDWCTAHGALMVMDEMVYGGRWAKGGGTEFFGVLPDLACFGKAIGNGAPIACVVGYDCMDEHAQAVSGTYSGDVPSLSAVSGTLARYRAYDVIATLWARGQQLKDGLDRLVSGTALGRVYAEGYPVHQRLRFAEPARGHIFSREMAQRGVLWHPDVINVCAAHQQRQISEVLAAAAESLPIALNEEMQ